MKEYDIIIIGSGSGTNLIDDALQHNKTVALVDRGPVGGTCLNVGCIPTKLIVFPADRIMEIREAKKFGITAQIGKIDFAAIMARMRASVKQGHDHIQEALGKAKDFDFYFGEAQFTADYTLQVNDKEIRGKTLFLASGARPFIPPIKGIESIEYLTNETALQLMEKPESLAIIGGGYIAVEFAHFFDAMGTKVTIIQRNNRLVPEEEPEVSALLNTALSRRMTVHTDTEATEVRQTGKITTVVVRERKTGKQREITVQHVLIAAGRKSNADALMVGNTGVKTNEKGYIIVDEFFETTKKNIWAFGDAIGKKCSVMRLTTRWNWCGIMPSMEKIADELPDRSACRVLVARNRVGRSDGRTGSQDGGAEGLARRQSYVLRRGSWRGDDGNRGVCESDHTPEDSKDTGIPYHRPPGIHPDPGGCEFHGRRRKYLVHCQRHPYSSGSFRGDPESIGEAGRIVMIVRQVKLYDYSLVL